ncbi:MAG: hypothetical protein K2Y39_25285 [Candidatus Obscuribacterales bacterium]|nr:hypothetical protein [Candidatus Obscuribacterales bacterium]
MNRELKLLITLMVLCVVCSTAAIVAFAAERRAGEFELTEVQTHLTTIAAGVLLVVGAASSILLILSPPAKWTARRQVLYARILLAAFGLSWLVLVVMTNLRLGLALFFGAAFSAMCLMNSKSTLLFAIDGKTGRSAE